MKKTVLLFLLVFGLGFSSNVSARTIEVDIQAGGLQAALTGQSLWDVYDLVVTGTIDVRDIRYIGGWDLSGLKNIDLSGTTIQAFDNSPANEFPERGFLNKTNFSTVKLPAGTVSIGEAAFQHCTSLTSLELPASVVMIKDAAFSDTGLSAVLDLTNIQRIGKSAFENCKNLEQITFSGQLVFMGDNAFKSCGKLSNVYFSGDMSNTNFGTGLFEFCSSLRSFEIPSGVKKIEARSFKDCASLGTIIIPESVTAVGDSAFLGCTALSTVVIPKNVNEVGVDAFRLANVKLVTCYNLIPPTVLNDEAFTISIHNRPRLQVYQEVIPDYEIAFVWQDFLIEPIVITGIEEGQIDRISVSPSIVDAGFNVMGAEGQVSVAIYDLNGKQVVSSTLGADGYVSVSNLAAGVYLVKVSDELGVTSHKIVKK